MLRCQYIIIFWVNDHILIYRCQLLVKYSSNASKDRESFRTSEGIVMEAMEGLRSVDKLYLDISAEVYMFFDILGT